MATDTQSPGRNPSEDEYHKLTQHPSNPNKHDDQTTTDTSSGIKDTPGREDLARAENNPVASSPQHENQIGAGYRPAKRKQQKRFKSLFTKRRAIGGGAIGLLGGGLIALIVFIAGPGQLVQLSQILQTPGDKNSSDSANRLGRLFRYSKTGKISDTTMARLGVGVFGSTAKQLSDIGVEIETNPLTKAPTRTTFETDKLKTAFPELDGMSDANAKAFIAGQLGGTVTPDQIQGSDGKFYVDQSTFDVKTTKLLTKSTVGLLDDGKIIGGLKSRSLTKFFGLPGLFHPFSRIAADKLNNLTAAAKQKALEQQEAQNENAVTEGVEAEGTEAVEGIKSEDAARKGLTGALTFTGGACIVYSTAGDIVKVNRDLVILPAALMAANVIAAGEQIKSGQDLTAGEVGALLDSLNQNGKSSIWQGEALDALGNGGKDNKGLTDLPQDYKTAFSGDTTAAAIQSDADDAIHTALGVHAGGTFGACGTIGTVTQVIISTFAGAVEVFQEVASGGTLTPAVAAELAGLLAVKETLSLGETAILLHYIQGFVLNQTTTKLGADAFSGPVGGDLLAYGARSAANISAIASGGISLGNQASTLLAQNEQAQSEQQFKSMSLAQRVFDPYDYRTAMGRLVDNINPQPLQNLPKIASLFTNFGSLFSHAFSLLTPSVAAADQPYNWDFPQYGLPNSMLNDPNLADPYANAQYVATNLLATNATDNGITYADKAKACFGVEVSNQNSSNEWDVVPTDDVNPSSDSYLNANCNENSEDWHRMVMFVFDTSTMKAAACYQGDEQSCDDLGANANTTSETTTSSGSSTSGGTTGSGSGSTGTNGTLPTGSAQALAQQLVPYVNNGTIKCVGIGGNYGCSDITNTAKGVSIKGGMGCDVDALQPGLLGMLLKLAQMGHTFALSSICSNHHDDGLNGHAGGRAADFNTIDGTFMGPDDAPWTSDKIAAASKLDQDILSFIPASQVGFGQVGADSSGVVCHPNFDFMSGANTFGDTCTHQHVQVETDD